MMDKQLLPIGSVVQLANSTARVMVGGYLAAGPAKPGYVWDYSGFRFPLGYVDDNEVYCFDDEQIELILAMGYQDHEQLSFIDKLSKAAEKIKADQMLKNSEEEDE